jgi:hypothetical protein
MRRRRRSKSSAPASKKKPVRMRFQSAIKAMVAAGVSIARVEIGPDGGTTIVAGKPAEAGAQADDESKNPWDGVLADETHEKRPA